MIEFQDAVEFFFDILNSFQDIQQRVWVFRPNRTHFLPQKAYFFSY